MRILASLTALIIAGEALVLFVGIVLSGKSDPAWRTPINLVLLGLDVVTGMVLLVGIWTSGPCGQLMWLAGGIAFVTHAYRVWQSLAGAPNPFCFNTPLNIVNAIKLMGLAIMLIACIPTNLGIANQ